MNIENEISIERLVDIKRQCGENRNISDFWRDAENALSELIAARELNSATEEALSRLEELTK